MNSSRLAELERQRALVREQLAWLEREIARETAVRPGTPATPAGRPLADTQSPMKGPASSTQSASELAAYGVTQPATYASTFDEYQPNPKNAAQSARRGCFFAAAAALVLIAVAFVALYFYRYSDRPMLFPSRAPASAQK